MKETQTNEALPVTATLGQRVQAARKRRGFSYSSIERQTGIARQHLAAIEKGGIVAPGLALVARLAVVLEVPIAWLAAAELASAELETMGAREREALRPAGKRRPRPPKSDKAAELLRKRRPIVGVLAARVEGSDDGSCAWGGAAGKPSLEEV